MTREELINGNKLIARWMGAKEYWLSKDILTFPMMENPENSINMTTTHHVNALKYHVSTKWLHPVVKKVLHTAINYPKADDFILSFRTNSPIKEMYQAVIEFITWYNSNSK